MNAKSTKKKDEMQDERGRKEREKKIKKIIGPQDYPIHPTMAIYAFLDGIF